VASSSSHLSDIGPYSQKLNRQNKPENNTGPGKSLDEHFISDRETYVFPNSNIQVPAQYESLNNDTEVTQG